MLKKVFFWFFVVLGVFILGGIAGVFFEAFLMPRLADMPALQNVGFLKDFNERVTVINKTEQIVVKEEDPLEKIISQPATALVSLVVIDPVTKRSDAVTGVLLTNDGLLAVSAYGRAFDAKKFSYQAILSDGSVKTASWVGADRMTGLGFFRLEGSPNTPAVSFANSDDTRIGKRIAVIAAGASGYQARSASGIIGEIDRSFSLSGKTVASSEQWQGVFRPDIADLSRFDGALVVDANGEMQGIVGMLPLDGDDQAFVIPANAINDALSRVIAGTIDTRAVLGAYYLPITKELAVGQGLGRDQGALIYSPSGKTGLALIDGAAAQKAGLRVGDIISAVGGHAVTLDDPLPELLSPYSAGNQADLTIVRDGEEKVISVQF